MFEWNGFGAGDLHALLYRLKSRQLEGDFVGTGRQQCQHVVTGTRRDGFPRPLEIRRACRHCDAGQHTAGRIRDTTRDGPRRDLGAGHRGREGQTDKSQEHLHSHSPPLLRVREEDFPKRSTLAHFAPNHRNTVSASATIGDRQLIPVWYQLASINDEGPNRAGQITKRRD